MSTRCPDCGAYAPAPGTSTIGDFHKRGCRNAGSRAEWRDGRLAVPRRYDDVVSRLRRAESQGVKCQR